MWTLVLPSPFVYTWIFFFFYVGNLSGKEIASEHGIEETSGKSETTTRKSGREGINLPLHRFSFVY